MIDAEVLRLRRLRDVALWTRALTRSLDAGNRGTSVFARSSRAAWSIARVTSGKLRSHPFLSYQQDAGLLRAAMNSAGAALVRTMARRRGRAVSTCMEQMQVMAREIDDVRAVTWSPDLSDTLGRAQVQVRRLIDELKAGARQEAGSRTVTEQSTESAPGTSAAADWPYLAI